MKAFHSNWTRPFFSKHVGSYYIEDFEILTTILSALKWQEFNGDIQMITDVVGASYYKSQGMEPIWNLGIECLLDDISYKINPNTFWAAGKLYALKEQTTPCVMLDTDFIIWETVEHLLKRYEITVIHKEHLEGDVYPYKDKLEMNSEYNYHKEWDWDIEACNTAFTFFNNTNFKDYYVAESIKFMKSTRGDDPLIYMVFAEQRLLSMCGKEKHIDIIPLSNTDELFHSNQSKFTHVWGYKRYIRDNPRIREAFCKRCISRIKKDYPDYYSLLFKIDSLRIYL